MKPVPLYLSPLLFVLFGGVLQAQAPSEDTYELFKLSCVSCHTIGGGALVGPDLKGVEERQDRAWLLAFMENPQGVIDSGDPYALRLLRESKGQVMTQIPNYTKAMGEKLLDLIAFESELEKSQFAGLQISERPLTQEDVDLGKALFEGGERFQNGAPSCLSCHAVHGLTGLGGGQLGPDLTSVYARLEGRKPLASWLSAPPSEVMAPVFQKHPLDGEEVLALVAFLKETAEAGHEEAPANSFPFVLAGLGSTAVAFVILDLLWRNRYRATRKPLVEKSKR
ncbi:MAG: cytochrome c [Planctomycetota bacterium]|nr:MAG: cytochrome c [Planctomycetota bacterium]